MKSLKATLLLGALVSILGLLPGSAYSAQALIRLTQTHDVMGYVWSKNGNELYMSRGRSAVQVSPAIRQLRSDLYRVSTATGAARLISRSAGFPSASPDGNRITFLELKDDGSSQLEAMDLTSNTTRDLDAANWGTVAEWTHSGDNVIYSSGDSALEINPESRIKSSIFGIKLPPGFAASPNGDRLAYSSENGLHIVTHSGDAIVFRASEQIRLDTQLRWSPDGSRLAFVATNAGLNPELWVVGAEGAGLRKLEHGGLEYFSGLNWAPDGSSLVFSRSPTGSSNANASEIWNVSARGSSSVALTHDQDEESSPSYSPDGSHIAFIRDGDLWVGEVTPSGLLPALMHESTTNTDGQEQTPAPAIQNQANLPSAQLAEPGSIRVMHDPKNTCRSVPPGQIDTFDFETYVKRVVPVEVYPTWAAEALKTQAVAARSYAWYWILQHIGQDYDVTDSTTYQYFCDKQFPSTDAAVDATRGQYGEYGGKVIFAAYGANNGDPTSTNSWGNPYLIAVDDPVNLGNAVSGNGIGMSQWGAERWALPPYAWNYQQILTHYYSGVNIESAAGTTPDSLPPVAGIVGPWSNWGVTSNHVLITANASDDSSQLESVNFIAKYSDGSQLQTVTLSPNFDGTYWNSSADLTSIPDQTGVTVSPIVVDPSGNTYVGNGIVFTLDRSTPTGSITGPLTTQDQTVTLHSSASDSGPAGLTYMSFSNNWIWKGVNQSVTDNSGIIVDDAAALGGKALMGELGVNRQGYWYGPYTDALALGQSYRAYFRLKTDNVNAAEEVAMLDVVSNGGSDLLGLKRLRGTDFRSPNVYQEFYVEFVNSGPVGLGLEFRVAWRGTASLWFDRIIVVSQPVPYSGTTQWTLPSGEGAKTVQAKFLDGVGNASSDAVTTIFLGALPSSTPTMTFSPTPKPTATSTPVLKPEIWLPLLSR